MADVEEGENTAERPEQDAAGDEDINGLADVKQLGLWASIATLGYVFWVVGGMELVERCAYYGVRAVSGLYATAPRSEGGLGIDEDALGTIFMAWALVQSLLPVFTGGLSDRYGYKETIFLSTVLKIAGYLIMALYGTHLGFFLGAMVLATGTAIFKPGIQGTLVNATRRDNSSMAWGVFYQTVNIGGWLGPLVAAYFRERWGWHMVFYVCSGIICLNFLLLLTYKEPKKDVRLERAKLIKAGKVRQESLWKESLQELKKTHVWLYLAILSGFWFMFNALFDVLPLHIRDWVDTQSLVTTLFGADGTTSGAAKFFLGMNETGTAIKPEGMVNLNAGLIMITCFFFAWVSGRMRATTSMVVGTMLSSTALVLAGYTTLGIFAAASIVVFSIGEMLASPKSSEFIGNFAPADKKAMYLGFSQIPLAIGWTLEGKLGASLYGYFGSKEKFAREMLLERGMPQAEVDKVPKREAFKALVDYTKETPEALTRTLHDAHNIETAWLIFAFVGVLSALFIYLYGRWVLTLVKK